ncbi:MAG: flagellar assembly protein FliW [Lachnospiraceae bacterium]|nr:flagellar assembly protein FliW [Lachnospiraceae bacterium]MCI7595193.1 flagellar assembly protein FliW [Lachnospiraceae bacterium]MDD7049881.1 flagellar assembly protein FliW [Lachnospiraceae bacterium]MDY3222611.1 flagellar assembly protein FliW [Lachnospiraceae bacterium]MDY4096444.1 flagellar assembly protein FliW [Lachnospiraceae bacterium]
MKIETRIFGEIEIDDSKIIRFPGGIIGFPEMTDFALIHDEEKGKDAPIRWLQSLQETQFAMPVMDPLIVSRDYNPEVEDELLNPIQIENPEEVLVLVTVSVPRDITKMSVNLQAPIIINAENKKAAQVIVDTEIYPVKYYIYDTLQQMKKEGE